jgi:phage baseplate assembly protein W
MSYLGMDANTGRRIGGKAHLDQSVRKILTTSIGTRFARRPFGSLTPDLIDAPANPATIVQLYAAAATALMSWEPRLSLRTVKAQADATAPGRLVFTVTGDADIDGDTQPVTVAASLGA